MSFRKEPPFTHGTVARSAIVLVNLGTPDAPTRSAVRRYLKEFLSDPRVVEIPRAVWWFILNLIILPFRSGKSAAKYATIWTEEGSPLKVHTQKQALLLRGQLGERGHDAVRVVMAMRYGSPSLPEVLDKLRAEHVERVAILPAYPQYAGTTTGSIADAVFSYYRKVRNVPELRLVKNYHDHESYIDALRDTVLAHWDANGKGEMDLQPYEQQLVDAIKSFTASRDPAAKIDAMKTWQKGFTENVTAVGLTGYPGALIVNKRFANIPAGAPIFMYNWAEDNIIRERVYVPADKQIGAELHPKMLPGEPGSPGPVAAN